MAELLEMPPLGETRVGPRNLVSDGVQILHGKRYFEGCPAIDGQCEAWNSGALDTIARPAKRPLISRINREAFGKQTRTGRRNLVLLLDEVRRAIQTLTAGQV